MIRFSLSVAGDVIFDRAFNRLDQHIADFRNFAPVIAGQFYQFEGEQFESEGVAGASGKWAPLSKAYEQLKTIHFPGEKILQATHHMIDSLTDPDALDAVYIAEVDQIILGTKDEKALAHHRGLGRLPARPVISFSERQKRQLQKAIQRDLVKYTRSLGFQVVEEAA